ncbi:unnamed protein product, partial [Chrysoparadoxa australica]
MTQAALTVVTIFSVCRSKGYELDGSQEPLLLAALRQWIEACCAVLSQEVAQKEVLNQTGQALVCALRCWWRST